MRCRREQALGGSGGARAAGVDVVYEGQASIAQPDFTSECQGASGAGAEVLAVFLDPASLRRLGQSCARQGYTPVFSEVAATVTADLPTQTGLGEMLLASPTFSFIDRVTPAQQEFQEAWRTLAGGAAGPTEAHGWTNGKLIERAAVIAAETTGTITSASLIDALHTLEDETLGGLSVPLTFPAGRPGVYPSCWFAMEAKGGTWSTLNDGKPVCK